MYQQLLFLSLPRDHQTMENLNEREVHPVVHPEDGDRRQVWSVHAVDGEEHNNEAKDGPAHYVA